MKIINTNIGKFKLFYNENKLEEIEFNFENQKLKIKKSIIFEKKNYEIINILENKLVGFNYYNKKEISNILNLNNVKGMFHLVYDYNEYVNNVKEKYKVRYFLVDKKYQNYLDLIKRQKLQGLLKEAFFKNMTEDLYKDIDNNLFLIVLNFARQKIVNKNLIINNNPFDINHFDFFENFKDEEILIQTISELEENIERDIEEIFNFFQDY